MSELSQMSTLNTKQDVDKQIAYIRSYLIQLKDEIESELNNVTYEMLSRDLKKRIDMINDDVVVSGEDKSNGALVLDSLLAQYASIGSLIATVGEIQTLTSMLATINTLAAQVVTATTLTADSVTARAIESANINASGKVSGDVGDFKNLVVPDADFTNEDGNAVTKVNIIQGTNNGLGGEITIGDVRAQSLHFGKDLKNVFIQPITTEQGTYNVLAIQ